MALAFSPKNKLKERPGMTLQKGKSIIFKGKEFNEIELLYEVKKAKTK